ncbi:FAD-binding protein [bacterium]|nr:FAD-binding protein [bacterium]
MRNDIPLAPLNWFKTGGNAEFFSEPQTLEDALSDLAFAKKEGLEVNVLGEGANTLVADQGCSGLVLHPANKALSLDESPEGLVLEAGCGANMQDAIDFALERNALGLEEFAGLPGTVGGAAFINAHFFEYFLADFLLSAKVISLDGSVKEVGKDWFEYGYDVSRLHREKWLIWSVRFLLRRGSEFETAFAKGRAWEIIRQRSRRYPKERTCGSFFRNFLPEEIPPGSEIKVPNVAYYLDKIGVKGALRFGKASVSRKHANMLETEEGASSADVVGLAREMQKLVYKDFNLVPVPECRFLGFASFPLYTKDTIHG